MIVSSHKYIIIYYICRTVMPTSPCNGCSFFKLFHISNFYIYIFFLPDFTEKVPRLSKVEREVGGSHSREKLLFGPKAKIREKESRGGGELYNRKTERHTAQYIALASRSSSSLSQRVVFASSSRRRSLSMAARRREFSGQRRVRDH